jgi:hypothetical protein
MNTMNDSIAYVWRPAVPEKEGRQIKLRADLPSCVGAPPKGPMQERPGLRIAKRKAAAGITDPF